MSKRSRRFKAKMQACKGIAKTGGVVAAASMALVSRGYGEAVRVQLNDYVPVDTTFQGYDLDGDDNIDVWFDNSGEFGPMMVVESYTYGGGVNYSCYIIVGASTSDVVSHDPNIFINNMIPKTGSAIGFLQEFYNQPSPRYAGFFFCHNPDTTLHQAWIELEITGELYTPQELGVIAYGYETEPLVGIFTGAPDPTGIKEPIELDAFALHQNIPNPFNPTTTIQFDVPESGGHVALRVYDVSGRLVRTLADGVETSGRKSVTWDGRNNHGSSMATGVYFYRLTAPGFTETRKMVLVQ